MLVGIEIRALDQHVFRVVVNFRVLAAHDARERDAFLFVGDEEHVVGQACVRRYRAS